MHPVKQTLKLSHRRHTGRLRPHEHTSYLPLAVLVLVTGFILLQYSVSALVQASPGPQAGSIGLSGTMPANPPTVAATIASPADGQHFATSPINVSGSCPTGTLVEVYKNDIFAGSAPCDANGSYSVSVDLLFGQNNLIARVYDTLNQAGPDSNTVIVFYDVLPPQTVPITSLNFTDRQLLIETDAVYRGTFPGQPLAMPLTILGGTAPFAVNVQWGENSNSVIPHGDNTTFNANHTYQRPGTYEITIQASDSVQHVAFLQVAAIVNGQPSTLTAGGNISDAGSTNSILQKLLILWPLYILAITVVISFWLGEQREKRVLATVNA